MSVRILHLSLPPLPLTVHYHILYCDVILNWWKDVITTETAPLSEYHVQYVTFCIADITSCYISYVAAYLCS